MPDSVPGRIFNTSRAGIGSSDGRGNTLKKEEILEPFLTRRRDAAGWSKGKREIFGPVNSRSVETARARSRKAGRTGPASRNCKSSDKQGRSRSQARRSVSEPPGGQGWIFGSYPAPRRNRHRRERRATYRLRPSGGERDTPGDKRSFGSPPPVRVGSAAMPAPFVVRQAIRRSRRHFRQRGAAFGRYG